MDAHFLIKFSGSGEQPFLWVIHPILIVIFRENQVWWELAFYFGVFNDHFLNKGEKCKRAEFAVPRYAVNSMFENFHDIHTPFFPLHSLYILLLAHGAVHLHILLTFYLLISSFQYSTEKLPVGIGTETRAEFAVASRDAAGQFFCGVFSRTKYFFPAHKMMCLFSAKEFIRDEVPWKWAAAPSRQRREQTQFDASRTQSGSRDGRRQRSERKWRQTERGGLLSILQDAVCRPLAQGLHHEEWVDDIVS